MKRTYTNLIAGRRTELWDGMRFRPFGGFSFAPFFWCLVAPSDTYYTYILHYFILLSTTPLSLPPPLGLNSYPSTQRRTDATTRIGSSLTRGVFLLFFFPLYILYTQSTSFSHLTLLLCISHIHFYFQLLSNTHLHYNVL